MQELLLQFVPSVLLQLVLAAVFFILWRKLGRNPWPVTILTLIPLVGLVVSGVVWIRALFIIADRLNMLENRANGAESSSPEMTR